MKVEVASETDITELEKLSETDLMDSRDMVGKCYPAKSDLDDHMLNMHISDNPFLAICTGLSQCSKFQR